MLNTLAGAGTSLTPGYFGLAERRHCAGIHSRPVLTSSDPATSRWVFRAAVFKTRACRGFVGYGHADPSNVSPPVRGAEMRVARSSGLPGPAQSLRHRHLLGRRDRSLAEPLPPPGRQ